jgi:uncharacterized protein (TIGR03663 family)
MARKARRPSNQPVPAGGTPPAAGGAALTWTDRDRRYWPAVVVIFLVAVGLRLFHLGVMSASSSGWIGSPAAIFQHDEAIYSIFSYNFQDYNFDPVYHGPTLYHIIKSMYLLFGEHGDHDFSARLVSVVMGLLTLWMVIDPGRRWLGSRGALWALGVLAISPVMVTYQRRILFDAWVVVLTLGSVLCFQNAISNRPGTWRWRGTWIGLVALLTVFLCTKANSFFVIAMLISFWVLTRVRHLGPRDFLTRMPTQLPLFLFVVLSIAAALALRDENQRRNELALQVVGFVCSLLLWEWLRRPAPEPRVKRTAKPAAAAAAPALDAPKTPAILWPKPDLITVALSVVVGAFLYAFLFGHGYRWWHDPIHEIRNHWPEIKDAMPRMLQYWGGQQKQPRLPGRHDFYLTLMIAYELPILIAAVCGIYRASRRRTRFTDLLLWWTFTSYTLYAVANEKVPWLMMHVLLPFGLLAGWWLGQVQFTKRAAHWAFTVGVALSALFLLRNVCATNYERALDHREPMFYAFTSEAFRDAYFKAIEVAHDAPGDIWIFNAWPASWYMRHADKEFPGAAVFYDEGFPAAAKGSFRLVVCKEEDFETKKGDGSVERNPKFVGLHKWIYDPVTNSVVKDGVGEPPYILLWPRLSWSSLRPDKWIDWFITRKATTDQAPDNSTDPFLTEWSHIPVVVATP